jgi:IMP dehydrogenase/GMP reductase
MVFEQSIPFDKVSFKQKKNICKSRLDVDTSSEIFRGYKVQIPLIASNMSTVISPEFLKNILRLGAFGFLHRALNEDQYLFQVSELVKSGINDIPVSIGVGDSQYQLARRLVAHGANIILIDIAHGYSDPVIGLGRQLKKDFPHIKMIVGNTNNVDMMYEVDDFADAVKVGLANGLACETKNTAGCVEHQFSVCLKFKEVSKKLGLPIISDGGTREGSHFGKAILAGASSVMAGSIFAACPESAAEVVNGKKLYAGMASEHVQNEWKGGLKPGTCAEGGVRYLDVGMPLADLLEHYQGSLRTCITYTGAKDIKSAQDNVEWIYLV